MSLDFESVVHLVRKIKSIELGRNLQDAEIMALYCAWYQMSYKDFIKDQKQYRYEYAHLYKRPGDEKSVRTLPACSSHIMGVISSYYGLEDLNKHDFKLRISKLYREGKNNPNQEKNLYYEISDFLLEQKLLGSQVTKSEPFSTIESQDTESINNADLNDNCEKIISNQIEPGTVTRTNEILDLSKLIRNYSIILLYGFHGVGKTYLLNQLGEFYSKEYKYFYSDFGHITSLERWILSILPASSLDSNLDSDELIKQFFSFLEGKNLIILDSVGKFNDEFISFFNSFTLGQNFNSKIIVSSSYRIRLNIPEKYYGFYELEGLTDRSDIDLYFNTLGLKDESSWPKLAAKYAGNMRELKYVSQFINDVFSGQVSDYLETKTNLMSGQLNSIFSKINLSKLDRCIFRILSNEKGHMSPSMISILKENSSTNEVFSRINLWVEQGLLVRKIDPDSKLVEYCVSQLFRNYLIQEKMINA